MQSCEQWQDSLHNSGGIVSGEEAGIILRPWFFRRFRWLSPAQSHQTIDDLTPGQFPIEKPVHFRVQVFCIPYRPFQVNSTRIHKGFMVRSPGFCEEICQLINQVVLGVWFMLGFILHRVSRSSFLVSRIGCHYYTTRCGKSIQENTGASDFKNANQGRELHRQDQYTTHLTKYLPGRVLFEPTGCPCTQYKQDDQCKLGMVGRALEYHN